MTAIEPFTFPTTGQPVRTVLIDGEPWFVAADVTDILGYANGRMAVGSLPDRMRSSVTIPDGTPGNPNRTVLNEAGVYRLVMRSNMVAAEAFQDWLAEQVIPSIRRTGSYAVAPRELSRLELIDLAREAELARLAESERADRAEAIALEMAPAAHAWDALATAHGDVDVARAAQILSRDPAIQTGRARLFTWLANHGWIYRGSERRWCAYQRQVDLGRLMVLPSSHYHPRTGELVLDPPQIRVTVKGLLELHRLLGGTSDAGALVADEVAVS